MLNMHFNLTFQRGRISVNSTTSSLLTSICVCNTDNFFSNGRPFCPLCGKRLPLFALVANEFKYLIYNKSCNWISRRQDISVFNGIRLDDNQPVEVACFEKGTGSGHEFETLIRKNTEHAMIRELYNIVQDWRGIFYIYPNYNYAPLIDFLSLHKGVTNRTAKAWLLQAAGFLKAFNKNFSKSHFFRGVMPHNITVSEDRETIQFVHCTDLFSRVDHTNRMHTAPEDKYLEAHYTNAVEVFDLGLLAIVLTCGLKAGTDYRRVLNSPYIPQNWRNWIVASVQENPFERPSLESAIEGIKSL